MRSAPAHRARSTKRGYSSRSSSSTTTRSACTARSATSRLRVGFVDVARRSEPPLPLRSCGANYEVAVRGSGGAWPEAGTVEKTVSRIGLNRHPADVEIADPPDGSVDMRRVGPIPCARCSGSEAAGPTEVQKRSLTMPSQKRRAALALVFTFLLALPTAVRADGLATIPY